MADTKVTVSGEWIVPEVSYVDPLRIHCALCGRPIARQHWRTNEQGASRIFCDPDHADLYQTWWIPTHGADANR